MRALPLIVAASFLAPPAFALNGDQDVQFGEGWRFVRFESFGHATLVMRVTFEGPSLIIGLGYIDGAPIGNGFHILGSADGTVAADTDIAGFSLTPLAAEPSTVQAGFITSWPHVRDRIILAAGGIQRIEYSVDGPAEYEVLSSGDLHSYTGAELEGGAWAKTSGANAMAHASALRHVDFDIEHTLVGGFAMPALTGVYPGVMTLRSDAATDTCGNAALMAYMGDDYPFEHNDCIFRHYDGPLHRGAGHYRLDWTGVAAAYGNTPAVVWADVPWPDAAT